MPDPISSPNGDDAVRVPELDLESIDATVRKLLDRSREQARQLDSLSLSAGSSGAGPFDAFGLPGFAGAPAQPSVPDSRPIVPILELEGEAYEDEVDALSDWVDGYLMRIYGAEVSTAAPWCDQWQAHEDVVAWLHSLWLAYLQHKDPDSSGLAGMAVWHRDFLVHVMATVRAPGGPMSACMTDPDRRSHRRLPGPPPSPRSVAEQNDHGDEVRDDQ
ncbi:DUF4913 domain-containing protein [Actinacidiphila sp. bgisy144]|uniref:DUF4913 domain-containing protein n=1 Tax=Actinacidiphila sp. bgisy144 TaxID=3413791 RepID=UPI003EBCC62E